jgi:thiol-disulfide isomerase/thioredoxin
MSNYHDVLTQKSRRLQLKKSAALGLSLGIGATGLLPKIVGAQTVGSALKLFPAPLMNGEMFKPESFAGGVNLIYAWASWCPHCLRDLPVLQAKYEEHKAKGFNILGLNMDDNLDHAEKWIKTYKVNFPSTRLTGDYRQTYLPNRRSTPSWWLAGRDGNIVDSAVGGGAEFIYGQRKSLIDKLVSQPG